MKGIKLIRKIQSDKQIKLIIVLLLIFVLGIMCNYVFKKQNIIRVNGIYNIEKYKDYFESVGKSVECENIAVTLKSAAADKNILILNFLVNNTEEIADLNSSEIQISSLKINGKEKYLPSKNNLKRINRHQAIIRKVIMWDCDDFSNDIDISMEIEKMFDKKGRWNIDFTLDGKKISQNTYSEKINSRININDFMWMIESADISPFTMKIESSHMGFLKDKLGFLAFDKDNNELIQLSRDESVDNGEHKYIEKYIMNEPLERVKIIPIYYNENGKNESSINNKINLDEFHQFYLNINTNLSVKIEDCIIDEDYIILKYNYEYMGNPVMKNLNELYLKYDDTIYNEKESEEIDNIKKQHSDGTNRVAVFENIGSKNIEIGCYDERSVILLEDYTFEIEK